MTDIIKFIGLLKMTLFENEIEQYQKNLGGFFTYLSLEHFSKDGIELNVHEVLPLKVLV